MLADLLVVFFFVVCPCIFIYSFILGMHWACSLLTYWVQVLPRRIRRLFSCLQRLRLVGALVLDGLLLDCLDVTQRFVPPLRSQRFGQLSFRAIQPLPCLIIC